MFFVFASGRMISPNTIITAASKPANRGSFMSVKSAFQQLAIALSAIVSGMIVTIDPETNLYENYQFVGYLSIFLGVSVIYLIKKIKVAEGN
jgi:predicted MFS family arabinose efflux permease